MPRLSRASAAASPPMPAPTTTTCFDVLMATSYPSVNRYGWPAEDSLRFHAGCLHHRAPARNFPDDESREVPRRADTKLEAELFHAGDHLRGLQRRVDRGVELVHDIGGGSRRRPHPGPEFEREFIEAELRHGGHVGQMGIALRARYGQRLDLALANERQHRRGRRPVDVDAAAQH